MIPNLAMEQSVVPKKEVGKAVIDAIECKTLLSKWLRV